jgi:hypothetical protein
MYLGLCDCRRGMDWILDLLAPLGTTSNYSVIADLHIAANTKSSPTRSVLTSLSLATVSNSGDSSASRAHVVPSPTLVQNCLPALPSTELGRHLFSII